MRWQALFDDLEAQAAAADAAALQAEVVQRRRLAAGRVMLVDRLGGALGHALVVAVSGGGTVRGRLLDVGPDWLLLDEGGGRDALVPTAALLGVTGLGRASASPDGSGEVARRLDLRWALRGLVRDRAAVQLVLRDGSAVGGTLDRVGADHVDVAEHLPGEPRRAREVHGVRLVPLEALVLVRRG